MLQDSITSSLDLASNRALIAEGSSWALSFKDDASSSGNAPLAVNSTSACPMAPDVLFSLIISLCVFDEQLEGSVGYVLSLEDKHTTASVKTFGRRSQMPSCKSRKPAFGGW
jgi:hypothetical protein